MARNPSVVWEGIAPNLSNLCNLQRWAERIGCAVDQEGGHTDSSAGMSFKGAAEISQPAMPSQADLFAKFAQDRGFGIFLPAASAAWQMPAFHIAVPHQDEMPGVRQHYPVDAFGDMTGRARDRAAKAMCYPKGD